MNLTEDEIAIIRCVCKGMDNNAIAAALSIEPSTAKSRTRHVMAKVGVNTRAKLAERGVAICGRIPRLDLSCLTQKEQEIAKLIAEGKSNEEIGVILFYSKHTINTHLRGIYKKLGIEKRAQLAAAYALAA